MARYKWAVKEIAKRIPAGGVVLDACCGIGYGSLMLSHAGYKVDCVDRSPDAAMLQRLYFSNAHIRFLEGDAFEVPLREKYDAIVTIETIEHLREDDAWISKLAARTKLLIGTVPNERVVPFATANNPWHFRHYTKEEFDALMPGKKEWFTQYDKWDPEKAAMRPGDDGMTLGVVCEL